MITTEVLSQSETHFVLSVKVNNDQEWYGRALLFARVDYMTLEQQIAMIVDSIVVPEVVEMPVPEVINPDEGA